MAEAVLVDLSARCRHIVTRESDHDIPLAQPQPIVEAVRQLVVEATR